MKLTLTHFLAWQQLNQEITALQGVINVQAIDELQFGLFFFMSLESALLSGKPSRRCSVRRAVIPSVG